MSLTPGSRLGPYEVQSQIGAGGMGEVYRARDTTLNRGVALKVLPASLDHDVERLARFRCEAQVLASLNHPHIAQIHGIEESGATHADLAPDGLRFAVLMPSDPVEARETRGHFTLVTDFIGDIKQRLDRRER